MLDLFRNSENFNIKWWVQQFCSWIAFQGGKHLKEFLVNCLLDEFPAKTRLTVYRRLDILTHSSNSRALPPRRSMMLGVNISIELILWIWVTSSVTFKAFKLYWSFIFPEYQLSRWTKLKFWTRVSLFENVDIVINIFKIFWKLSGNRDVSGISEMKSVPMKNTF